MKIFLSIALLVGSLSAYALADLSPSNRIQSNNDAIIELAENLTAGKHSDLEKSRAIHEWITNNISYDQPMKVRIESGDTSEYAQDAITVLQTRIAVCEGYANLTAALHRAINIPAKISIGKFYHFAYRLYPTLKKIGRIPDVNKAQGLHAWNEIKINGKWIPMDTTSDAGSSSGNAWVKNPQKEFFSPDLEYFNATHLKQGEMDQ